MSGDERQEDRAEQRLVGAHLRSRVRAREDGGRGLAAQLIEGEAGIGEREQPSCTTLHVVAGQRPVLVERGPVARGVRVERKRELVAVRQLAREERERAQAEPAQG